MILIRLQCDFQGIIHTKLGSCNPRAVAQELRTLAYNWSQELSLYRNEIISASYFASYCFINENSFCRDFEWGHQVIPEYHTYKTWVK